MNRNLSTDSRTLLGESISLFVRWNRNYCGNKAGERVRTVNIQLGRLMLCQLSYARIVSALFIRTYKPVRIEFYMLS